MNCSGEWGRLCVVLLGTQNALCDLALRVVFFFFSSETLYVADGDLEVLILLSTHKCWITVCTTILGLCRAREQTQGLIYARQILLPTELHLYLLAWLFRGMLTFQVAGDSHMRTPACKFLVLF